MYRKSTQIGASQFKTQCLQLLDEVKRHHIEFVITKHGKPYAKLIPIKEEFVSLFGYLKDTVIIRGNIIASTGEKWDAEN